MSSRVDSESIERVFSPEPMAFSAPWWWSAAVVEALLHQAEVAFTPKRMDPAGVAFVLQDGEIVIAGDSERTETLFSGDGLHYWGAFERAQRAAGLYRRQGWKLEADAAIEHYYRARARGSKITLKDIAEMTGYNYTYLSQVKSAYDKAGKWGSKPKYPPKPQT